MYGHQRLQKEYSSKPPDILTRKIIWTVSCLFKVKAIKEKSDYKNAKYKKLKAHSGSKENIFPLEKQNVDETSSNRIVTEIIDHLKILAGSL